MISTRKLHEVEEFSKLIPLLLSSLEETLELVQLSESFPIEFMCSSFLNFAEVFTTRPSFPQLNFMMKARN
jgi:hypothetical protein